MDIITLDALDETQKDPESEAAQVYKQSITVQNTVTLLANLLTNDSSTYASFAVLIDQSIGRAVRPLPASQPDGSCLMAVQLEAISHASLAASILPGRLPARLYILRSALKPCLPV